MLQLFDTDIDSFFTCLCRTAVVVLPVVCESCITFCLFVDGIAESVDPAFTKGDCFKVCVNS